MRFIIISVSVILAHQLEQSQQSQDPVKVAAEAIVTQLALICEEVEQHTYSLSLKELTKLMDGFGLRGEGAANRLLQQRDKILKRLIQWKNTITPSGDGAVRLSERLDNLDRYIEECKQKPRSKSQHTDTKTFTIRLWERDPKFDIFSGGDVGCCLAPNSSEFPAMLDRLMDGAMIVFDVREDGKDKKSGLSWAYLAEDKENNKLVLVANFYEIASSVAGRPGFAERMFDELSAFYGAICTGCWAR